MGGLSSGRWGGHVPAPRRDECFVLTTSFLAHGGYAAAWGVLTWPASSLEAVWGLRWAHDGTPAILLAYQQSGEVVLDAAGLAIAHSVPGRRGRLYLRCAGCGRRCGVLYLPWDGAARAAQPRFRCRHCWGIAYPHRRREVERMFELLERVGSTLEGFPADPQARVDELLELLAGPRRRARPAPDLRPGPAGP